MIINLIIFSFLIMSIHITCKYLFKWKELLIWYLIHSISNIYITYLCLEPISYILHDPIYHLINPTKYYITTILIIFLHLYHILFFNCTKDDLFHHYIFVSIGSITIFYFENGYFSAFAHFFVCGFPGAIDYFFLFLYQFGCIYKETRLKVAMFLNVWIRSPGLSIVATFSIINFIYSKKYIINIIEFILQLFITIGNGQMYLKEVVFSAGKYLSKNK